MNKTSLNHKVGFALLILVISFFFYKSIFIDTQLNNTLSIVENAQDLQVHLHRDLLRYRNNQIQSYDILNTTLTALNKDTLLLTNNSTDKNSLADNAILDLKNQIKTESSLVKDFITHHSILQNSLAYIFKLSSRLHSANGDNTLINKSSNKSTIKAKRIAQLITLLLEYNENPGHNISDKIYPIIDALKVNSDSHTRTLIQHSLVIIERMPVIDEILEQFNSLAIENKFAQIKNILFNLRNEQTTQARIFNILLFISTIYLIFYLLYIFITLQRNKDSLSHSNQRLSDEIKQRKNTELALYQLVNIDKNINNDEDRILFLLNALCSALNVEYAYISTISSSGDTAQALGYLTHGILNKNITYAIKNTPCEDVFKSGRLVHQNDFADYYPNRGNNLFDKAISYIGISLRDKKENTIGMLAIASESSIADINLAENILTIASSRAILELEHQTELNKNKRYQQGLALIDNWIARLITEGYDKSAFFKNICLAAQEITNSQLAVFPALHENQTNYSYLASSGRLAEQFEKETFNIKDGSLCAWVITNNKDLLVNDLSSDSRKQPGDLNNHKLKSALLSLVTLNNKPYGTIAVYKTLEEFDDIDKKLMAQFSQSIQMAIINMQLLCDIKTERERAEVTLRSIGDAVITTNINGNIEYMNQLAESLTAWPLNKAKNKDIKEVFRIEHSETNESMYDIIKSCLQKNIVVSKSILLLVNKNGNKIDIESSISPILNTSGKTEGIVIVFHDETQRRHLENQIKYQATHDPLTDLLNRNAFDKELQSHVYSAINYRKHHVLCYLDLDRFKLINDTAGHAAGDQCLIQITSLIQSCIRGDDILSRLGGDEFGLLLKNCTLESALKITNSIVNVITEMAFTWDGFDYNPGVSIGINPLDENTKNASEAIKNADLACYTAKDQGRGQVYIYEEKDRELLKRQEEAHWATHIAETIEKNRIRLYAQAIVPLKNNKSYKRRVEILVRLIDEDNKLVLPNSFIPAAERYNLMHLIDRKIIHDTFSFIQTYSEYDCDNTHYSINISGNTLGDEGIVEYISGLVEQFEINSRTICFEITECTAIKNLSNTRSFMMDLKAMGFEFTLDDFGSGLSSFQYLKKLPVDYLKIDGSFVADMVNNKIDHAMVAAINEVGHIMGIETIAEYVENDQIIKKLKRLKVDYGQGYGLEQPKPLQELLPLNEERTSPTLKVINSKS